MRPATRTCRRTAEKRGKKKEKEGRKKKKKKEKKLGRAAKPRAHFLGVRKKGLIKAPQERHFLRVKKVEIVFRRVKRT